MTRVLILLFSLAMGVTACSDPGGRPAVPASRSQRDSASAAKNRFVSQVEPAYLPANVTFLRSVTSPGMITPMRVALGLEGAIVVSDPRAKSIFVFSPAGTLVERVNLLQRPLGIAVDSEGRYIVGDADGSRIIIVSPGGTLPRMFCAAAGEFKKPNDIAVDPVSGLVWIADSGHDRVVACTSDGIYVRSFGQSGENEGDFHFPVGIAVDPASSEVYVGDLNNGRVQIFDAFGVFKRAVGTYGGANGQLARPAGIALDHLNRLYVGDLYQSLVEVFDPGGTYLQWVGTAGDQPGQLLLPTDMVIDQYRRLIIVSQGTRRLEVLGLEGYTDPPDPGAVAAVDASLAQTVVQYGPSIAPSYLCLDVPLSASDIVASSVRVFGFLPLEGGTLDKNAKCNGRYFEAGGKVLLNEVWKAFPAGGERELSVTGRLRDGRAFAGTVHVSLVGGEQ
jgi:DNA-binding beta-propeller fold protein YncE